MSEERKTKKSLNIKALVAGIIFLVIVVAIYIASVGFHKFNWAKGTEFFITEILLNNFLGVDMLLIGFLVLIGYLILGRGVTQSILGCLKSIIGVLILKIGAGTLVGLAKPVFVAFNSFGKFTPLDPYFGWQGASAWLQALGSGFITWISYALLVGLTVNIILVALRKWTNVHSLMITGHVMFQQAAMVVPVVFLTMFLNNQFYDAAAKTLKVGAQVGIILISGVLLGAYWGVASSATIKGSDVVTENAGFAVGHQQMFGLSIAYGIGRFFGKKENSAENKKLSDKFKLFEDNIFTQSLIILALFFILIMIIQFAHSGIAQDARFAVNHKVNAKVFGSWNASKNAYWVINLILGSLKLVGSVLVLQMGVRMFVTELQQSFQGISEKLVPGAVVAVDVAATYGFSPNSVTYGFVAGTIAQFLAMFILIGLSVIPKLPIPVVVTIPLFITLFFNSGSIGVFANASGGFIASLAVPAIFGFVEIMVCSLGLSLLSGFSVVPGFLGSVAGFKDLAASPFTIGYNGMFDFTFFFSIVMALSAFSNIAAFIVFPVAIVLIILAAQVIDSNRQEKQTVFQKMFNIKPNIVMENKEELQTA